jgi:multiple sugar transport system ATP-binding protein
MIGIRPEHIHGDNGLNIPHYYPVDIVVDAIEPMGSDSYLYFKISGHNMIARIRPENAPQEGKTARVFIDRSRIHYFHPENGKRL